jgi:hemerythrin-like domain-containing protein
MLQRPPMVRAGPCRHSEVMTPQTLQIIRQDHAALSWVLRSLLQMVDEGPGDAPLRYFDVMRTMLFYIDEFPERLHHPKESNLLFPKLVRLQPALMPVIQRLEEDHMSGERRVWELQHRLLAWELIGESRRNAFTGPVRTYVQFYLEHMRVEEAELLPVAEALFTPADWDELDAAFATEREPLGSGLRDPHYDRLFSRILRTGARPAGATAPVAM